MSSSARAHLSVGRGQNDDDGRARARARALACTDRSHLNASYDCNCGPAFGFGGGQRVALIFTFQYDDDKNQYTAVAAAVAAATSTGVAVDATALSVGPHSINLHYARARMFYILLGPGPGLCAYICKPYARRNAYIKRDKLNTSNYTRTKQVFGYIRRRRRRLPRATAVAGVHTPHTFTFICRYSFTTAAARHAATAHACSHAHARYALARRISAGPARIEYAAYRARQHKNYICIRSPPPPHTQARVQVKPLQPRARTRARLRAKRTSPIHT